MECLEDLKKALKENGVSDETITRVLIEISIHILSEFLKNKIKVKESDIYV